jgi:hypothetical protein
MNLGSPEDEGAGATGADDSDRSTDTGAGSGAGMAAAAAVGTGGDTVDGSGGACQTVAPAPPTDADNAHLTLTVKALKAIRRKQKKAALQLSGASPTLNMTPTKPALALLIANLVRHATDVWACIVRHATEVLACIGVGPYAVHLVLV